MRSQDTARTGCFARAGKVGAIPRMNKAFEDKTKDSVPREFSKKAIVLDLLRRKDGATMAEIAKATKLAEPQHPGIHLRHDHQEDGLGGREHEK